MRKVVLEFNNPGDAMKQAPFTRPKPNFFFVSKFEKGKITKLGGYRSCREYLCQDFMKRMRNSWGPNSYSSKIDTKRVRLGIYTAHNTLLDKEDSNKAKEAHVKSVQNAVRVVNLFEKKAGWPLTKAYELFNPKTAKNVSFAMFIGPSRWVRSIHMLSLYTLLLRFAYMAPQSEKVKRISDLLDLATRYYESKIPNVSVGPGNPSSDANYIHTCKKEILALTKNFDEIFRGRPMSETWSIKAIGSQDTAFPDGIYALTHGTTKDIEMKKRVGMFK